MLANGLHSVAVLHFRAKRLSNDEAKTFHEATREFGEPRPRQHHDEFREVRSAGSFTRCASMRHAARRGGGLTNTRVAIDSARGVRAFTLPGSRTPPVSWFSDPARRRVRSRMRPPPWSSRSCLAPMDSRVAGMGLLPRGKSGPQASCRVGRTTTCPPIRYVSRSPAFRSERRQRSGEHTKRGPHLADRPIIPRTAAASANCFG